MKKIAIAITGIILFTACSKDRTCECDYTSTGTDKTVATDANGDQVFTDTETYNNSGTNSYTIKATKRQMYRGQNQLGEACVSTESPDNSSSSFSSGGTTVTTTRTGTTTTTCELKD